MKKIFILAISALAFTACEKNDPTPPSEEPIKFADGVFVLNQGHMYSQIPGSLTYFNIETKTTTEDAFKKANDRVLGDSPQAAVVYGSKIYVGMYGSNTIEVLDRATLKSIKQITLAETPASEPRDMIAENGHVYISMYTGFVSRLDTVSCEIDKTLQVGPNPEMMAIHNGYLYVPNSDGMNWDGFGHTASRIKLDTFSNVEEFETPLNPTKFLTAGENLYLLCMGDYNEIPSQVYKIDTSNLNRQNLEYVVSIAPATIVDSYKNELFLLNAPFSDLNVTYQRYNVVKDEFSLLIKDEGVIRPDGIGVDKATGRFVITSYYMDGQWPGYSLPGYAKLYDADGNAICQFSTSIEPRLVLFNTL